jgi:hypothetical protein
MKKFYKTMFKILIAGIIVFTSQFASGQVVFTSVPDSSALVGELYTYDVEAVASPNPAVYSLDGTPLTGMTINSGTGLISWTPTNINQGGKVTVKAVNNAGTYFQTYYVFVSDAISCPNGLQSYWKLDAAMFAGDSTPDYAGSHPAYALANIADTIGLVDKAFIFRNASQYLRVPDRNQYDWQRSSDFSFSLWFKHTGDFSQDEVFIGRANGTIGAWVIVGIDHGAQQVVFRLRTNYNKEDSTGTDEFAMIEGSTITNNQWHHVVAVYDGNPNNGSNITAKLYIDGVKYQTSRWLNADYGFTGVNKDLTIGWFDPFQPSSTFKFKGYLDEVTIYSKALSDAEATALHTNGLAKKATCAAGNHVPIITSVPVTAINEDVAYSYKLVARDYEGTTLTKSAIKKPSWLSFAPATGILSGTPRQANVGDTTVTLRVSDGTANVDQTFALSVANVNFAPVISSIPGTSATVGQVYSYQMTVTDQDPFDVHTFAVVSKPAWLAFQPTVGLLTGIPAAGNVGSHSVTLSVNDGTETVSQTFSILVHSATGINDIQTSNTLVGKIFPVPATSSVSFSLNLEGNAKLEILTITGTVLKQVDIDASQTTATIDVSDLDAGVYLFRIIENNTMQVGKLIVE